MAIESTPAQAPAAPAAQAPAGAQGGKTPARAGSGEHGGQTTGGFVALMAALEGAAPGKAALPEEKLVDPLQALGALQPLDPGAAALAATDASLLQPALVQPPPPALVVAGSDAAIVSGALSAAGARPANAETGATNLRLQEVASPLSHAALRGGALHAQLLTSTAQLQNAEQQNTGTASDPAQDGKGRDAAFAQQLAPPAGQGTLHESPVPPVLLAMLAPEKPSGHGASSRDHAGTASMDLPVGFASPSATSPTYAGLSAPSMGTALEVAVAEKVSYWIGQDVQKAELRLDGLGKDAVQVSITMVGNEAQVAFRSDEAATRQVLEAAAAHLKDMLQREGVVLTGVSVGSSGAGDARHAAPGPRQGARHTARVVAHIEAAAPAQARNGPQLRGTSVDLFV